MLPFNRSYLAENTLEYIQKALETPDLQGDGYFTKKCHQRLEQITGTACALLTPSGTAALEMAALLIDLREGDEVIMPSYTFSSTANAIVLRGATPVFVDIRRDTLNINEKLIEQAITDRTKAIVVVHYAGYGAQMDTIAALAQKHNLFIIEDAAQGIGASFKGKPLGTLGHLGAFSFHASKNIMAGEGGALLINDSSFIERAEIIREKGTNRSQFLRGDVDKYTWHEKGSSYLPSELTASLLLSQLDMLEKITENRLNLWSQYHSLLSALEEKGALKRPPLSPDCTHNAHSYYILLNDHAQQKELLAFMKANGIQCTFHYVPLHSSPAGKKYGRSAGSLPVTNTIAETIVRLPLWPYMRQEDIDKVVSLLLNFFGRTVKTQCSLKQ